MTHHQKSNTSRVIKVLVLTLLLITIFSIVASPTFAYSLLGGKWGSFPLYYYIGDTSFYLPEIYAGANSWNSAGTRVSLYRTYSNGYENIWITGAYFGYTTWAGWTINYPSMDSNPYTYSYIKLNSYWMDGYSYSQRVHMTGHEFGHSIGLDHSYLGCNALMDPNDLCATAPQADDISGTNALYP